MVILYENMLRNINQRKMNDVLFGIICGLGFGLVYGGTIMLFRWSIGKTLVITWKPFSIKIENQ